MPRKKLEDQKTKHGRLKANLLRAIEVYRTLYGKQKIAVPRVPLTLVPLVKDIDDEMKLPWKLLSRIEREKWPTVDEAEFRKQLLADLDDCKRAITEVQLAITSGGRK